MLTINETVSSTMTLLATTTAQFSLLAVSSTTSTTFEPINGSSEIPTMDTPTTFASKPIIYPVRKYPNPCISDYDPSAELFQFYSYGVLLNIIGLLGILGNIISMIILSRPQMRSSINYLLICLALCDIVLILSSMLLFGLSAIYPYTGWMFTFYFYVYPHLSLLVYPLTGMAQTASVYLTLTVTLERFVAVCQPLRARSLCTLGRARLYVIVIIIFSVLYNFPKFFEPLLEEKPFVVSERLNVTVYCVGPSELRTNDHYIQIYTHWLYLVFLYFIPFSSLAVLNAAIYRQVRKANAERQRLSRLQRREIGLATMLLCVVMVFFLCNVLPLVVNLREAFYGYIWDEMVKTSNLLVTINSSVNFIIYVIFGEKFKRIFLRLFCSHGIFGTTIGRESPDGATHDDSLASTADRQSIRLHRQNTAISRNGMSIRNVNGSVTNGKDRSRSVRARPPSPGPCVYYPASRGCKDISIVPTIPTTMTIIIRDVSSPTGSEWENGGNNSTGDHSILESITFLLYHNEPNPNY